jgi:hypothetical protein
VLQEMFIADQTHHPRRACIRQSLLDVDQQVKSLLSEPIYHYLQQHLDWPVRVDGLNWPWMLLIESVQALASTPGMHRIQMKRNETNA